MGVQEFGRALVVVDVIAVQLGADDLGLARDDVTGARGQIGHRDFFFDLVAGAVQLPLVHSGEVEHRFAQGLRRDRAGVDADATGHALAVDDGDALAELGRGNGGALTAGTAADDEQVEVVHR